MKIQALTIMWGEKYISRFRAGMLKCLSLESNKKAMEQVVWNIFGDEAEFSLIDQEIAKLLPNTEIRFKERKLIRDRIDYLHAGLLWQIKECLSTKSKMLLLPPDTIMGDKTLKNLFELGKEDQTCVVVPHPRVTESILSENFNSNESLVTASFKHLHRSWQDAEDGSDRQNTYISGVRWKKMDENLYWVKHYMPTPYFCDFIPSDIDFFEKSPGFGDIDWIWPGKLVGEGRQRYCTSSDACFLAEISDDSNHAPVVRDQPVLKFHQNNHHNFLNNQVGVFFRGTK